MADPKRDQDIRVKVRVHMCMQVRAELVLAADICLDDRALFVKSVVFSLTHQCLGNSRDVSLCLHPPVRVNIGHLRVPQSEDIDQPVIAVDITRHCPAYDQKSALSLRKRKPAKRRQVPDQISGPVVGCGEHKVHGAPAFLPIQVYDHIFLFIQVKTLKPFHGLKVSLSVVIIA